MQYSSELAYLRLTVIQLIRRPQRREVITRLVAARPPTMVT